MRQRERLVINRQTGERTMTTEVIDDNAGFAQRIRELKDSMPDIGPVEARFLGVTCNGCGTTVSVDFDEPRLPGGWVSCDEGDFCPNCQTIPPN
jgi:hypothetical protein